MLNGYEENLKQAMETQVHLKKAGFPKKTLVEMETEVHRKSNEVDYWTCNCGSEYGDHEAAKLIKCPKCGRIMCPACKDQHGPGHFNKNKYGLCFKEK